MQPSVLVIASSSLGRAFGAFVAQVKPHGLLLVDPDSRRAELMKGRLFCLDFGSEFSVHQKILRIDSPKISNEGQKPLA